MKPNRNDPIEHLPAIQSLLRQARDAGPDAPLFLKARVLAELRSERHAREQSSRVRFWKIIGMGSPALSLLALLVSFSFPHAEFRAPVNQAIAIRVQVDGIGEGGGVTIAEIELPEGVQFFSNRHPELREVRSLRLAWNPAPGQSLPIAVQSSLAGTKKIRVRLLDVNQSVVETREISIRFEGAA